MTEYFKVLSDAEYEKLREAIAVITIYIAGIDGNIEDSELEWAEKVTKIRAYNLPEDLAGFYKEVGVDFHETLEKLRVELPKVPHSRNPILEERLSQLNPILAKLDPRLGSRLYSSYRSFAKHVAKASGGFFGFFSIGPKEAEVLDLNMLTPITYEEEA